MLTEEDSDTPLTKEIKNAGASGPPPPKKKNLVTFLKKEQSHQTAATLSASRSPLQKLKAEIETYKVSPKPC